jgi:hypothetical protein
MILADAGKVLSLLRQILTVRMMNTFTLKSPDRRERIVLSVSPLKYDFMIELLRHFDFVHVEDAEPDGDTRNEIVLNLQQASRDLQLVRAGKLESRPVEALLNELEP